MSDQQQQEQQAALLKALIDAAPGIQNGNLTFICSTIWFLWDWVISIDQEVEHFWGKRLTTGTTLYFLNRFLGLLLTFIHFQTSVRPLNPTQTANICKPLAFNILVFNALSNFVVQTVLVLRTYALWDCNKIILYGLMGLSASATVTQLGLVGALAPFTNVTYNPLPAPYNGCIVLFGKWTWERYVPILVFEITVAAFMLIKFVQFYREGKSTRITYVLFRDGFLEFMGVTVSSAFSLFVGIFQVGGAFNFDLITFDLVSAISLVVCARMLLNIRDVMTLSDPRDSTKPNPWSLSPSFDEIYGGLGGQHEITREESSEEGYYEKEKEDSLGQEDGTEWSGGKMKGRQRDEEEACDSDLMFGLGGSGDGTASVFSASPRANQDGSSGVVSSPPSQSTKLSDSSPSGTFLHPSTSHKSDLEQVRETEGAGGSGSSNQAGMAPAIPAARALASSPEDGGTGGSGSVMIIE